MASFIPELLWAAAEKPGSDSQTGCVYCLSEGVHAPVDIVYIWGGTSMCRRHVEAAAPKADAS